jgi:hypothetical protein
MTPRPPEPPAAAEPPAEADELYGIDPEKFTAERNALAKRLRAAGQRDEAAAVARLRRPPATAWALNRVARDDPAAIDAVLDAGSELRAAMDRAVGGDAAALRQTQAGERAAVDAAVEAASTRLAATDHHPSDATRQRLAATLRAAIVDQQVADRLRAGTLDADHEAPGFGFGPSTPSSPAPRRAPRPTAAASAKTAPAPTAAAKTAPPPAPRPPRHVPADDEARRAAAAPQREVRAELERLERAAERAAHRAARLRKEADDAEREAAEARRAADEADATADEAQRALDAHRNRTP